MFVSDTIHNAQYIHNLFFPHDDGPNLIKHNTSTWPQLIWPIILILILILPHPVLIVQFSPDIQCLQVTVPKPSGSSDGSLPLHPVISWVVITAAVNTYHWNTQIMPCNRGRFSSVFGGPRSSVTAVQLLIRGKPLPRRLTLLSVHFNNHQSMP